MIDADGGGEDALILSALNDYLYCPRRWGLHNLEGLWQDNAWTLSGGLAHETADDPGYRQTAVGARIERAVPLYSRKLNLVGKADIVEFWPASPDDGRTRPVGPVPVDYKLGPRRQWDNDDVQLCAQAICLEEMLAVSVTVGAIYHVRTHRRRVVAFNAELRRLTLATIESVRALARSRQAPPAVLRPQCEGCSVRSHCLPELTSSPHALDVAFEALFVPSAD